MECKDFVPKFTALPKGRKLWMCPIETASMNQLLRALPADVLACWLPSLELVHLPRGMVLCESGRIQTQVYFPTTAIVSLLYVTEDGASAEVAVVGLEGMVGVTKLMEGQSMPGRAVVQIGGHGVRLNAERLKAEFVSSPPVQHLLLRYTQALITQIAQTAACNRQHVLEQQLCRWLLMNLDRLSGNEVVITQELIANMLGVRREGVTTAAMRLQLSGMIKYTRGHITVLDRPGIEQRACECYEVVKKEYDRLLPQPYLARTAANASFAREVRHRL